MLKGEMFFIRFAEDFLIGFEYREDAQRVYQTLAKRFKKFGLTNHPERTKLLLNPGFIYFPGKVLFLPYAPDDRQPNG
jgi:hypothetical protein